MVDLITLGFAMVMTAIVMAYVATMCFIISHLIDGWLENKCQTSYFGWVPGCCLVDPGLLLLGCYLKSYNIIGEFL